MRVVYHQSLKQPGSFAEYTPIAVQVLIAGAGGSVGHYLTQLAHARGFEVIIASHERHWPRLKSWARHSASPTC